MDTSTQPSWVVTLFPTFLHAQMSFLCTAFYHSNPLGWTTLLSMPSTTLVSIRVHPSVTFVALYPQCFKVCYPTAKGSSNHLLFISAFMQVLASKAQRPSKSATTHIQTSLGVLSVRACQCLYSGRSTWWSTRCVHIWSGN
jgi:hypothetical protein